jgi:hypothetical protein
MTSPSEYIEKLVADAYKREADQEENVFRSMPFFATTFGVVATAIGLARPAIGPFDSTTASWIVHMLLAAVFLATAAGLFFLTQAIKLRSFKLPMTESALIVWRDDLERFYRESAEPAAAVGAAIVTDLRDAMTTQIAEATEVTRRNNLRRIEARGRAVTSLVAAIALVFALFATILVRDSGAILRHVTDTSGEPVAPRSVVGPGDPDRPLDPEAARPADANRGAGSLDLPGGRSAPEE